MIRALITLMALLALAGAVALVGLIGLTLGYLTQIQGALS